MDGEQHIVTGDALPWAEVARLQTSALVFWNLDRSQDTIRRLTDAADVLYPGHDRPFRLVDGVVEYQTPYAMEMFGADPSTEGLTFRLAAHPCHHRPHRRPAGRPALDQRGARTQW